jgi:glycosyltransferase involved in cell wall biosynthesis
MMTCQNGKSAIRVLFLDHTAKIGGGEIALLNLLRNLDRALVYPIVLLCADGPLVDRLRPYAEVHILPLSESVGGASKDRLGWQSLAQGKAAFLALRHVWKIASLARRMRVDLIHTNSLKADLMGGLAARLARIPVIWHVRDRIETDYLPAAAVRTFRLLAGVVPNFVIANSAATLTTLRLGEKRKTSATEKSSRPIRASIVHDGCNAELEPAPRTSSRADIRIGLIGRISPWKGQHIFLQAAALLHASYPAARFEIIGAPLFSEHNYEAGLHELRRSLHLERAVELAGFVEDIPERLATLDILVHASTIAEPFGQVIIEAMAAQKPVVATNGGGVTEIVVDGVTGLLVPMGDSSKMAEAIAWLIDNSEMAARMGFSGRQRVLSHFTIQKTARMVEAVYCGLLGVTREGIGNYSERKDTPGFDSAVDRLILGRGL